MSGIKMNKENLASRKHVLHSFLVIFDLQNFMQNPLGYSTLRYLCFSDPLMALPLKSLVSLEVSGVF